jgi:hypothetical protein
MKEFSDQTELKAWGRKEIKKEHSFREQSCTYIVWGFFLAKVEQYGARKNISDKKWTCLLFNIIDFGQSL